MARLERTITIKDRGPVTVYELSAKQIRQIVDKLESMDEKQIQELLAWCSTASLDEIQEMYPSEIRQLYDAWAEVNTDFLHLIRTAMKQPAVKEFLKDFLEQTLKTASATLSNMGMSMPGNTDTASFSSALEDPAEGMPGD
jgi:DNA-binding GntR family transcriptional regulator